VRVFLLLFTLSLAGAAQGATATFQIDPAMRIAREQAMNRPRRILWNHDGGGSVGLTKDTLANFLDRGRPLTPLIGTQVDAIMFCSSSDFGTSSHFTKVGHLVDSNYRASNPVTLDPRKLNDFLDPLKVVVDFGHANHMEVFWSMRMNDTHDGGSHDFSPGMLAANTFKQAHPDWLLGTKNHPPFHGIWTGVNYEIGGVRDYVFRLAQEVCQNYDVDGLEFDFFRHPNFFKYAGPDATTTQAQRDLMTDLLRQIRTMTDEEGKKRGRPILIAVKVPDSLDYDKAIGLDLEKWLSDGLVDLLIPGGYIRMNDWRASVELGHRFGVKVYPSMDDPRLNSSPKELDESEALRIQDTAYRGRAMEALADHADGIYLFNFFNSSMLKFPKNTLTEMGDPKGLPTKSRTYFASYLGLGKIAGGGFPHQPFQKIETLSPTNPKNLTAGATTEASVNVPENIPPGVKTNIKLRFDPLPDMSRITARLNGHNLASPTIQADWVTYACDSKAFINGLNIVDLSLDAQGPHQLKWRDLAVDIQGLK